MNRTRIGIIGGGLAGLTAAIDLASNGFEIMLYEKEAFPHHKVCGEYVSNEVLPYLKSLNIDLSSIDVKNISTLNWTTEAGKKTNVQLPLGGFGISRYAFDNILVEQAKTVGVSIVKDTVTTIKFQDNQFLVETQSTSTYEFDYLIGAYGKRSTIDKTLNRSFINKKTQWMAVKAHYKDDRFPNDLVALHNFKGGYCGLSKVETNAVNCCYLTTYKSFQKFKDIALFNAEVVSKNPFLNQFFSESTMVFEKPLSIAQISFEDKSTVDNHILMIGDSAGLIHPLCGNGMAMAIHSAKLVSETLTKALKSNWSRTELEQEYTKKWSQTFSKRLKTGAVLQKILLNPTGSQLAINSIGKSPWLLKQIIKSTHGKPLSV